MEQLMRNSVLMSTQMLLVAAARHHSFIGAMWLSCLRNADVHYAICDAYGASSVCCGGDAGEGWGLQMKQLAHQLHLLWRVPWLARARYLLQA